MNEIFLSYRRADEKGTTGRLFDHLVLAFGRDAIFYDVDKIPHGVDFREFIDKTIRGCKVVLIVIGPRWLDLTDESGRRLDQPNDPVRIEVETALRHRKRVIPVLIDEAGMPDTPQLPATIVQLAAQNAAPMHNNQYFEHDINALLDDVTRMGVARKTQGFIQNPPAAGFLSGRQTAAIVGLPLVFVAIGVAAVLGIGYLGYTFVSNAGLGIFRGNDTTGAHPTLTHFCAAMAANDYQTAFSDLTPAFQARIGGAQNLPTGLTTDFSGQQVTVIGCQPFSTGSVDLAYHESGDTADDEVTFNVVTANGSNSTVGNKKMFFAKQSGIWKIDRVQDG
jgi:hypothetical protein